MFISKHELSTIQVYLRAILQYVRSDNYGDLAYLVDQISEDLNLHKAAKQLLFSFIDFSLKN